MCGNCENLEKEKLQPVRTNFTEANNLYQCSECNCFFWDDSPSISGGLVRISEKEARSKM